MNTSVERFIDFLKSEGFVDTPKAELLSKQETIEGIVDMLVGTFEIPIEDVVRVEASFFHFGYVDLVGKKIDSVTLSVLPKELAETYQVICFERQGTELSVGLVDPTNLKSQEAVGFLARGRGWTVKYSLISPASFKAAFQQYSALGTEVNEVLEGASGMFVEQKEEKKEEPIVEEVIKSAPVSKMIEAILKHAVETRASDIHIEPVMEETRVRYRIDGELHTALTLPKYLHASLVSRVKVLSNLKIDETRIPQDGRIRQVFDGKNIDFRVSTLPLYAQEKVVMRILESGAKTPTLADMGFWGRNLEVMEANIRKPHGMFLVTGPTGSGKSTTLYSVLNMLNKENVNIVTLEDPVEYYLKGVNQSQVNPEVGYTFAVGLRSILRQDPDIIQVGEIRDNETAELAIHAALTGHIVLSTLHTNDAFGALPRLVDMKVEPFLLASTVNVIVAQRLVRKVCSYCKVVEPASQELSDQIARELMHMPPASVPNEFKDLKTIPLSRGKGCPRCDESGYSGRTAISEVLAITDSMQKIIVTGLTNEKLKEEFSRQGLLSLKQDGVLKVLQGVTTMEEIMTATKG